MLTDVVNGLGDTDFWAHEFPCGLQIVIQFHHMRENQGFVCADSPEINHVIRHLPFPANICTPLNDEPLRKSLELLLKYYPERQSEIDALHSFQVWRQGEDGNPFRVGDPTSERDARCRIAHFESLAHKQSYWYATV